MASRSRWSSRWAKVAASAAPIRCSAGEDGDNLVLIASKGGTDRHPAWYHNLHGEPRDDGVVEGGEAPGPGP